MSDTQISSSPIAFQPIGRCIYCGSENNLAKEHILPLGLGGNWTLPKSSCRNCTRVTGQFERLCLRPMLGRLRIRLKLPTRRPNERPDTLPLEFIQADGSRSNKIIPAEEVPFTCLGYRFPAPGILRDVSPTEAFEGKLVARVIKEEIKKHFDNNDSRVKVGTINILAFARMLAKIGHSYAVAKLGLNAFEPLLPPIILGRSTEAPYLVGGDASDPVPATEPALHAVYLQECDANGVRYLLVAIRLFALFGMPRYHVVVGRRKNAVG